MDGQHQYEINLKKDDLFICLSSDDVYFISKQMDKWFSILLDDSYVPVSMPQRPAPVPAPVAESVPVQPLPQPQLEVQPQPLPEPVAPVQEAVQEPIPEPIPAAMPVQQAQPEPQPQPMPVPQEPLPQPAPQAAPLAAAGGFISRAEAQIPQPVAPVVSAEANDLLAQQLMQQMLQQQAAAQPQPGQPSLQDVLQQVGQPNLPDFVSQPVQAQAPMLNGYQEVNLPMAQAPAMQQQIPQSLPDMPPVPQVAPQFAPQPVMQAEAMPQPIPQPIPEPVAVAAAPALVSTGDQDDFEAVMNSLLRDFEDKPAAGPNFSAEAASTGPRERIEPDLSGVTSLADLCDRSNAANSEDYLLLSAYYLSRMERQDTFSLKKVNSVLVKSGLTPVNHSVLETVLTNGYLSMLPDLTGMAEVTEYQISKEGVEAAIALL